MLLLLSGRRSLRSQNDMFWQNTCTFPQKKVSILSDIVIEFDLEPCKTT